MKKTILIILVAIFCVLSGTYFLDPNRMATLQVLQTKGAQTGKDYILSSLNVTAFARDQKELMWIGTSAGINVYDGKEYIQFFHDTKDTTALPDDFINVLHLDKAGRMWVGTQNGLARYAGAYRFHRVNLPDANGNIVAIEDAKVKNDPKAVVVSNGKNCYMVHGNDEVTRWKGKLDANNIQDSLPEDAYLLRKPRELVTSTFKDLGGNLWVGYRNAGYQIISPNRTAYLYANHNPLAEATAGRDIVCLERVGAHILAGTTLRLYIYDTRDRKLGETFYRQIFGLKKQRIPAPRLALNNIVPFDDDRMWLVGNHHVLSCSISNGQPLVLCKSSFGKNTQLGFSAKVGGSLYLSSQSRYLLRFPFGGSQPDSIAINSRWYDEETQLTTLQDGKIFLFMKDMNMAIYSPDNGKLKILKPKGIPGYHNVDPAFVRQDSYGNIWLGTKRYGLYRLDMKKNSVKRIDVLNDVHIQALAEDGNRQVWITTMRDAFCFQPETGEMVKNSLVSAGEGADAWQFFDNSICLSPDGNMVFGCSDGCKFLPPSAMNTHFMSSQMGKHAGKALNIYSLEAENAQGRQFAVNEQMSNGQRFTFAYDENHLRFRFFYPNYSRRSALMYQYQLEGLDKEWRMPTYQHEAEFADLAPGKYKFRVRLVSSPGVTPLAERSVEVIVKPAPWQSAAAWFLYLCILGYVAYYLNSLYWEKRTKEMNMSFFANISHEFRNPITIIAGPLTALASDESLPQSVQHTLNRVCMSVNRMLRLIDQMLDFNQLETDALRLKVSHVDAAEELRRQVAAFEESTKVKAVCLKLELMDGDYDVWMDVDKFEKILANLFTNALKHTSPQGTIRISASMTDGRLSVVVFNSGEHLAEDKLPDVFKRYYQLSDTHSDHHYGWGTGIGLYYVKRLVGLHHGKIGVRNVTGGVEFFFSLPGERTVYDKVEIVDHEEKVMQIPFKPLQVASSQPNPNKPKILVVDDDIDVAQYIRSIFSADYEVVNRYSAEEALADLEEVKPDIVLSDVIMGDMSGYEFCKRLKGDLLYSHIPVVLITAKSNMDEQVEGLRLGAVAYVTKPFDPAYLSALVKSQLQNVQTLRKRLGENTGTDALSAQVADTLSEPDRKFMDELYALMEKRAAEQELNVQTVCHDLLISQSKFNYKLKELTGETPGSFFRRYKLNKAAQLLREGKYNVSEIAVMTGFSTAAHFSVAFKKQFGVSPSEYQ